MVWSLLLTSVSTCLSAVFEFHLRYLTLVVGDLGGRSAGLVAALAVAHADLGVAGVAAVRWFPWSSRWR